METTKRRLILAVVLLSNLLMITVAAKENPLKEYKDAYKANAGLFKKANVKLTEVLADDDFLVQHLAAFEKAKNVHCIKMETTKRLLILAVFLSNLLMIIVAAQENPLKEYEDAYNENVGLFKKAYDKTTVVIEGGILVKQQLAAFEKAKNAGEDTKQLKAELISAFEKGISDTKELHELEAQREDKGKLVLEKAVKALEYLKSNDK